MTCDCKEVKPALETGDNGQCGDGMKFDNDAGKCVKIEKTKEQIGDPKTQSTQAELPSGDPGEQTADNTKEPCGPGETFDSVTQTCVPTDRKDPGDGQTQGTDKTASVEKLSSEISELKKLIVGKESKKPLAKVTDRSFTPTMEYKNLEEVTQELVEALANGQNYVFHIGLDRLRSMNVGNVDPKYGIAESYRQNRLTLKEAYASSNRTIREAVTITGTHATQDLDTDVAIIPGGISFIPVFQFAKVKQIEQGFDRARFFTSTVPANGSQTVGSTPSEAVQTFTAIEVVPSTITGVYLVGDYDEIENSPYDLLQGIVEGAALSYDDFVATDMLDTVSAEGTLTPGLWIRGDTGAVITTTDTASVDLTELGLFVAREYLEDQGYLRGGIKPVMVMDAQQHRELINSTNVTSLATRSVPDIWLKANLEEFAGVQIVVSNAIQENVAQTNKGLNALMFIPKHSYGIAVKRDVTVKFHDIGEDNQVRVNTTWRTKSGVLDSASIVRISTTGA